MTSVDKVKMDDIHVKGNFTFSVRCYKLSIISEERDFRGLVTRLVKILV